MGPQELANIAQRAGKISGGVDAIGREYNIELPLILGWRLFLDVDGGILDTIKFGELALGC